MFDYTRKPGESDYMYKWRIYNAKIYGECEDSWQTITDHLNRELAMESPVGESVYRKEASAVTRWYSNLFEDTPTADRAQELNDLLDEIKREQVKLRDERNHRNKMIRGDARLERRLDTIEQKMVEQGGVWYPCQYPVNKRGTGKYEMLVLLSDWHLGIEFSNAFGDYNVEIAKERLEKLLVEIKDIYNRYSVSVCHVVSLGDMISGNIWKTIQIQNECDVIDQTKLACELVCGFINELCSYFDRVDFMAVDGNHSRLTAKDDAVKSERLDSFVPWAVKSFLSHLNNFRVIEPIDSTLGFIEILGKMYACVHGDYDSATQAGISKIAFMLEEIPYAVCMGHMHYPIMSEMNGVKVVQCGCLCGTGDDYTISKRLSGSASQTVMLCGEKGIEKYFPVNLEL